jgi:hypothetical protein
MRVLKQNKEYLLDFLMKSNSLNDLLGILKSICENLDLNYLNPQTKHFRYFQFTFFGLMVKAKGLLEMMVFRAEFLKNNFHEFDETYSKLVKLKKNMELAYNLVNKKKMLEGKNKIIELNKEYLEIFDDIVKMCRKII